MRINEIGGEFALIRRCTQSLQTAPEVLQGVGDDCAVIKMAADKYQLVTTDMMVENTHFNFQWFSPRQVGLKLGEANVADILAMGGAPRFAFLSLALPEATGVELVDDFYQGLLQALHRHHTVLLGGDTTRSKEFVCNLTVIGETVPSLLCLRSAARAGDKLCVTGCLGGAQAGLNLFRCHKAGHVRDYLEPQTRTVGEARSIAGYAHAMIDVSDGLASEVRHICGQSGVGAQIFYETLPISPATRAAASLCGDDPADYALYGGEDFQLVFTIPGKKIPDLAKTFKDFSIVGEITGAREGIYLIRGGQKLELKQGYDHFAK